MIFPVGSTAVYSDVLNGKIHTTAPNRVLQDTGDELLLAHWPGIVSLVPRTWIDFQRTKDDALRKRCIKEMAEGRWELAEWTWQWTGRLSWYGVDDWFSLHRYFDLDGTPQCWYVNFERPLTHTGTGVETFDVMLDLVAEPDLSAWEWKDEDEYAAFQELGVLDAAEVRQIEAARERAITLIESRGGPLAQGWAHWQPDPAWPLPVLPAG